MLYLLANIDFYNFIILIIALFFVLFYEVINGFHDTANAVATIIYTRSLTSKAAVIMAGIFNFIGVILGGLSVAYTIVHLIPTDLLINFNTNSSKYGLSMIFSIVFAAIIWNLSTWYLGLPASSSHTLIGSIIGTCMMHAIIHQQSILNAFNILKIIEILISLVLSPIFGFIVSGFFIFLMRKIITKKHKIIHMTPTFREKIQGKKNPPFWIRISLIISSIGVSYSHGANDGQKGIGLIMLVLIIITPANFILNMHSSIYDIQRTRNAMNYLKQVYIISSLDTINKVNNIKECNKKNLNYSDKIIRKKNKSIDIFKKNFSILKNTNNFNHLNNIQKKDIYKLLLCIANFIDDLISISNLNKEEKTLLSNLKQDIICTIEYAPMWIIVAVALALSLGTMIGWKPIANTIGKKIGKKEITYAQGLSSQITSAISISTASYIGMPVSTPYILSSSLAGAIIAGKGKIQYKTIKNILLAWILTLPVSIILSGSIYCLYLTIL